MSSPLSKPLPGAVIGVAALNRLARDLLERALPLLWVRGEVSNFNCAASGHCYFTLKDSSAQVRCAMFRSRARLLDWQPQNGMQIEVRALVTLFEARGEFQLTVETIRRAGLGALYEAFERLKSRLSAEGLFDVQRKRPLPPFPRAIGVVTSPQAAALRDVLSILARRMPNLPVIVYPTPVQGAGAGECIAAAIDAAARRQECDVLIVCRGGGSIEDLWAFNEEVVARAIHASAIPVVAGVGHETDFTIADFVADVRAPTPSAAAEAVSPDRRALVRQLAQTQRRLRHIAQRQLDRLLQQIDYLSRRLVDPRQRLLHDVRQVRRLAARLSNAGSQDIAHKRWRVTDLARRLLLVSADPARLMGPVGQMSLRLQAARSHYLQVQSSAIAAFGARLEALNPEAVLERGYALATDDRGAIVRDAATLALGDRLQIRFARGQVDARVTGSTPADATGRDDET